MSNESDRQCPRVEDISALMDGALAGAARDETRRHLAHCPVCGTLLERFEVLGTRLQSLREERCDVDLAAVVVPRLPPRDARPRTPSRGWPPAWQLAPRGLAAAGALAAGAWLGLALAAGAAAPRHPAMAVFDAAPPGALCAGLAPCTPRSR